MACAIALAVIGPSLRAAAQPVAATEAAATPVVVVVFDDASASHSPGGLAAQLGELPVTVVAAPSLPSGSKLADWVGHARSLASEHAALCTLWFQALHASGQVAVYLYDAKSKCVFTRSLLQPNSAAAAEELAVAVRATLAAMAAGEELPAMGVVPERAAAPAASAKPPVRAKPPEPDPPGGPPFRLALAAGYLATSYATQGGFQHGATLFALARFRHFYAGAGYAWLPEFDLSGGGAQAIIARHPIGLLAGYQAWGSRFSLAPELALELEVQGRRTKISDARLEPLPQATRLRWTASPRLRGFIELSPSWQPFVLLAADVGLDRFDYVVESPGEQVRFRGRAVRPRVEVGLTGSFAP